MLKGAFTALVTPFKGGKVNYKKLGELIEFQIKNKIDGIVICGTTGESATLTDNEKKKIMKYTVEVVNGRVPVIAGTGSNSTRHTIDLSKYAEKIGVDALLIVTPYYNKTTQKGLIKHYKEIAQNVILPIIIYNVPSRTGVNILPDTVVELSKIENIVGIKEASNNFSQNLELLSKTPKRFSVLSGNDDSILPLLSIGGNGVISVVSNIYPKEIHDLCEAFFNNDIKYAMDIQLKYANITKLLFKEVNPMPIKDAMNILGFDVGTVRLPLTNVEEDTHELIKSELKKLNK